MWAEGIPASVRTTGESRNTWATTRDYLQDTQDAAEVCLDSTVILRKAWAPAPQLTNLTIIFFSLIMEQQLPKGISNSQQARYTGNLWQTQGRASILRVAYPSSLVTNPNLTIILLVIRLQDLGRKIKSWSTSQTRSAENPLSKITAPTMDSTMSARNLGFWNPHNGMIWIHLQWLWRIQESRSNRAWSESPFKNAQSYHELNANRRMGQRLTGHLNMNSNSNLLTSSKNMTASLLGLEGKMWTMHSKTASWCDETCFAQIHYAVAKSITRITWFHVAKSAPKPRTQKHI